MQLKPGTKLQNGKYKIIRVLGQGGFGITYEAEQVLLRRKFALKEFFMKDCCERDEDTCYVAVGTGSQRKLVEKFRGKFIHEAQMMAGLDHPNIVKVTDVFEENGTAYYVMENLPGGSLADKVKECGPLSEDLAEKYIRQVADALAYIHSKNMVHLDVKPSNILLNAKGDAVLIDFGISKHYDDAGEQTSSTPVGISKGYAPMEQGREGDVSQFKPSTDIYALGATLYHLVTGSVPPEASVVYEDGLERPYGVSDRIWHAIEQAMWPRRKDRPQRIEAFLVLLNAADSPAAPVTQDAPEVTVIGVEIEPKPKPVPRPEPLGQVSAPARKKSKLWLWTLLACAAVAAVFLGVKFLSPQTTGNSRGHGWVDLGLPSGIKWATCNLGASSPEEYGDYFAWGETTPKEEFTWKNYEFRTSGDSKDSVRFSKYNNKKDRGTVDNRKHLDKIDDAASVNWAGSWRIPTAEDFDELLTHCDTTWVTQRGVDGCQFTSKQNGKSIFLPAAGWRGSSLLSAGSKGYYVSSSLSLGKPHCASTFEFTRDTTQRSAGFRYCGFSIRPVTE